MGLMFQFPLCGEEAAFGKKYVNGNETQMSCTMWSEVCDVFKEAPYEICPSLLIGDVCTCMPTVCMLSYEETTDVRSFFSVLCFKL